MRWNVAVAALAASFGLVSIIVREVELDAAVLVFYRCLFAVPAIGIALLLGRRVFVLRRRSTLKAALLLGTTLGAHWFLFFETIKLSSVAFAVLAAYLAPIMVALVAPVVLPERRSRIALLALVPAGAGLALVALGGGDEVEVTPTGRARISRRTTAHVVRYCSCPACSARSLQVPLWRTLRCHRSTHYRLAR